MQVLYFHVALFLYVSIVNTPVVKIEFNTGELGIVLNLSVLALYSSFRPHTVFQNLT